MADVPEVDVCTFASELSGADDVFLLDVREPNEAEICSIDGATLIPLGQLAARINEVPRDRPVVVHCHHGRRSAQAVQYLQSQGYDDVRNLTGGIEAWAVEVDPEMARY